MIQYLFAISISWFFFLSIYYVVYKQYTFYKYNRLYLLGTIILGLIIPICAAWVEPTGSIHAVRSYLLPELFIPADLETTASSNSTHSFFSFWYIAYGVGVLVSLSRLGYGLFRIYQHLRQGQVLPQKGYYLVRTKTYHLPFSFFNCVFISEHQSSLKHLNQVLDHEEAHIHQWHTVDVLFMECLQIIFWFHPLVYIYKKALKQSHEYYADAYATRAFSKQAYSALLVQQSTSGLELSLANHFFQSTIKDRLMMIQKSKTSKSSLLLYFLAIPIIGILLFSFSPNQVRSSQTLEELTVVGFGNASEDNAIPASYDEQEDQKEKPFVLVKQMPQFPGCESVQNEEERDQCARKKLLEYVYTNIKYPKQDRQDGNQGTAVSQFVVDKNGKMKDIEIIRSVSETIDAEVIRLLEEMQTSVTWKPGVHEGKNVDVKFTLPVKFVLSEGQLDEEKQSFEFSVFPNPSNDFLSVKMDQVVKGTLEVVIYNKFGEEVLRPSISKDDRINIQSLQAGHYVIMMTNGKSKSAKNFTKL